MAVDRKGGSTQKRGESREVEVECHEAGSMLKGPGIEHENLFESAAKRHKLTEHIETTNSVHHVHRNPSIAKHRRRDSQLPHALDL